MNCPVCNKTGISTDKPTCPDCGSDLEAVVILTRLDESLKKIRKNLVIVAVIVSVVIIACLFRLYTLYQDKDDASSQIGQDDKKINLLKLNIDSLNNVIKNLSPQKVQNQKTESTESSDKTKIHVVKSGDSLWKLAQQYLGDGNKYLKLATDNNLEKPYLLREGQELKIYSQ